MNKNLFRIALVSSAVALGATLDAQQVRPGMTSAQRGVRADDSGPRPQAFSVALVLGELQASGGSDNVPPAARKALTDLKDFLPYKGYRLLDTQWTLCCGRSAITTRLRGPEDQDYALELSPSNAGNGKYYVHFSLWEPRGERADTASSATTAAAQQRVELERQMEELRKTNTENHPDMARLRARLDALSREVEARHREATRRTLAAAMPRRAIIDTSFTMDIGETVVVGTSRLKGDKALIALLTAVASTKSPSR